MNKNTELVKLKKKLKNHKAFLTSTNLHILTETHKKQIIHSFYMIKTLSKTFIIMIKESNIKKISHTSQKDSINPNHEANQNDHNCQF